VQEASDQQKILLLLFILGQESSNSIYPHETARSRKIPAHAQAAKANNIGIIRKNANKSVNPT
jgi:hypothetical protein